jgi:hypothetical protein
MTAHAVGGRWVLAPAGDLCEGAECDRLEREILDHLSGGHALVIDLGHTRLLSARALGILARAARVAGDHNGRLVVAGANRLQRFLLDALHLSDAIVVVDDVPSALRALDAPAAA